MRCIINVIIGNETRKQLGYLVKQERLRKSLKKHFKGEFLSWKTFPNDNYNKDNLYNVKAAAFEEAIKQGYKEILWVDSPVVALQDVSPIFDLIKQNGYLTVKNHSWNCAQTVNDKCLEYFGISRDEAERIQEVAGGFFGVDMTHTNGIKLIKTFIKACKDDAADGSRFHDNQSTDPRFKFHRQCQSVLTLSGYKHGLPHTIEWNTGPVALNPTKLHKNTVMAWSSREKFVLDENKFTRRFRNPANTSTQKNRKESYLYFLGHGGLGDIISELVICTDYAIKHKRSILFETSTYSAIDFKTVFDFSKYPVPIYTDKNKIKQLLRSNTLEPPINLDKYNFKQYLHFVGDKPVKKSVPHSSPLRFDMKKDYNRDTILIRSCGGGTQHKQELKFFKHVRLMPGVINQYKDSIRKFNIPEEYAAAHLRATDKPLSYKQDISGIRKENSNSIRKKGVDAFIEHVAPLPTYIASDNKHLITTLKQKYPSILHSDAAFKPSNVNVNYTRKGIHRLGKKEKYILIDAVIDLMLMAKAKILMTSVGGFSDMAKQLWAHKNVVKSLLRED